MAQAKPKTKKIPAAQPLKSATVASKGTRPIVKRPTRSGKLTRRDVAHKAAAGKSNTEIASELSLTVRRIEQIVREPDVKNTIEGYRVALERTRIQAEGRLLEGLLQRFEAAPGAAGLPFAELVEKRLTNAERRGSGDGAANAVQVNVNQASGVSASFEDLVRSVAPAVVE